MSNIDKQAVQAVADLKAGYTLGHADVEIIQQMALDAVTLLDELEAVQKTSAARLGAIDTTHKMFQRERDRADAAEKRSAELSQKADIYDMLRQDYGLQGSLVDFVDWQAKRIAELEAREVVLPSTQDVHPLGPQSAKIFCEFHRSIVNRCADEIRKVGVKVSIKGN